MRLLGGHHLDAPGSPYAARQELLQPAEESGYWSIGPLSTPWQRQPQEPYAPVPNALASKRCHT